VRVYTDGACLGNPGPGGWAWAVARPDGRHASGGDPFTTNQRMELMAVLRALEALTNDEAARTEGLVVVSDSAYVVNCFRERWFERWRRNGWRTARGHPVEHRDLWEPLLSLAVDRERRVRFEKVAGHRGDPMNELVDRLANDAARRAAQGRAHEPAGS
jgi:ribonuclease HI